MTALDRPLRTAFFIAGVSLSTGCNTGLDPRRFEQLHYGIPATEVPVLLEAEPLPSLRFFVEDGLGGAREWTVDMYRTRHPHPDYRLVYEEGLLVSVLVVQPDRVDAACLTRQPWTSGQLADAAAASRRERVPLAWSELEPLDLAARNEKAMHPTTYAIGTAIVFPFVVPMLLLYPLMLPFEGLFGDAVGKRNEAIAVMTAFPYGTHAHEVAAAMGAPDLHQVDRDGNERWFWEMRDGKSIDLGIAAGFEDGRLMWVDYRPGAMFLHELRP